MKLLKNIVIILLLSCFGIACFKLGWYSRDNPFVRPFAASALGLDSEENLSSSSLWKRMQKIIGNEDRQQD